MLKLTAMPTLGRQARQGDKTDLVGKTGMVGMPAKYVFAQQAPFAMLTAEMNKLSC